MAALRRIAIDTSADLYLLTDFIPERTEPMFRTRITRATSRKCTSWWKRVAAAFSKGSENRRGSD